MTRPTTRPPPPTHAPLLATGVALEQRLEAARERLAPQQQHDRTRHAARLLCDAMRCEDNAVIRRDD